MTCGGKRMRLERRRALAVGAAALALAGAPRGSAAATDELTVATWGGAYEASQRQALFEPFTAATGIAIRTVPYDGGVRPLREHLEAAAAPVWDVIDMIETDAERACDRGLLEHYWKVEPQFSGSLLSYADMVRVGRLVI